MQLWSIYWLSIKEKLDELFAELDFLSLCDVEYRTAKNDDLSTEQPETRLVNWCFTGVKLKFAHYAQDEIAAKIES